MVLLEDGPEAAMNFCNEINSNWGAHTNEWIIMPFTFPISTKYNSEHEVLVEMLKRSQNKK